MNICYLLSWCLLSYLQGLASSCLPIQTLSVEEGGDAVLQLRVDKPFSGVTWNYEKYIIATTKPGQPLEMGQYSSDYTGRLSSDLMNGSLIIRDLSLTDIRTYRAELFNKEKYICAQIYDIRINRSDRPSPDIEYSSESCGKTIQLYGRLGETVALQLPSRSSVSSIVWDINNVDHIAITRPGGVLQRQDPAYSGRFTAMSDGSLQMSQITTNDERIFRADVYTGDWNFFCTQLFHVKLNVASSCPPIQTLSVEEGGDAVLQLRVDNAFSGVTWNYEKHIVATTKPGQPLERGQFSSDYTGRLSSDLRDGSLIIRDLSLTDIRTYRAELFNKEKYICAQIYDIRINRSARPSPDIEYSSESCGRTIQLYHRLGETVALQLPSRSSVSSIVWDINNIDHIAITMLGGVLQRQDPSYSGRFTAMSDGSLKMSQITANDERIFRADVYTGDWNFFCTQLFHVTLINRNKAEIAGNYSIQKILHLALSACVLAAALLILLHHIRTECATNN